MGIAGMVTTRVALLLSLLLLLSPPAISEGSGDSGGEMDLSDLLQMGLALGKSVLGEEGMEKLKQGDLSDLLKVGERVLGEGVMNDFLQAAEGAMKDEEKPIKEDKDENLSERNIDLEWEEMDEEIEEMEKEQIKDHHEEHQENEKTN